MDAIIKRQIASAMVELCGMCWDCERSACETVVKWCKPCFEKLQAMYELIVVEKTKAALLGQTLVINMRHLQKFSAQAGWKLTPEQMQWKRSRIWQIELEKNSSEKLLGKPGAGM